MAASDMSSLMLLVMAVGFASCSATAAFGDRRTVRESTTTAEPEIRKLYIDPNLKPTSTKGWNVIVNVISSGKYTTVNNIKLRAAILKLGFPTDLKNFQFGGNAATTNWRSITSFVINIPTATSASTATNAVKTITVKALNQLAGLPKANPVLQVLLSAYKA